MTQRSSPFPSGRFANAWWHLYESAIFEQDDKSLAARIQSAVSAINKRRVELEGSQDRRERKALSEARRALRVPVILREAEQELTRNQPSLPRIAA
jgi:hypothetical protein